MCTSSVSNVIYHKFSHGAAFYTTNGKNINVMLVYTFNAAHCAFFFFFDNLGVYFLSETSKTVTTTRTEKGDFFRTPLSVLTNFYNIPKHCFQNISF